MPSIELYRYFCYNVNTPVIETVPPYSPSQVAVDAPTIYLSGRSRPSDPWHINASGHPRRAASHSAEHDIETPTATHHATVEQLGL